MRMAFRVLVVFAVIVGAGCAAQKNPMTVVSEPHFDAAPPIPMPRAETAQEREGTASATGTSSPLAQTFTCAAGGELAEIQFGIDRASPTPIDVSVELRSVTENTIDDNASSLLFATTIEASQIGQGRSIENPSMRLDVRPFKIRVSKGEELAIIFRPTSENGNNQYRMVNGHTYAGGDYVMEWNDGWKPLAFHEQLLFRVSAMTGPSVEPGTTQNIAVDSSTARLLPLSQPLHGDIIAECVARSRAPRPPTSLPAVQGKYQFRTAVFQESGKWYLELTVFNGTNSQMSSFNGPSATPTVITLTRDGDSTGSIVYPRNPSPGGTLYLDGRTSGLDRIGPGQGTVRQFLIADVNEPLAPGIYHLSIAMPSNISPTALTPTFRVP